MIQFFKKIFNKTPPDTHISKNGCPNKCQKCGSKEIKIIKVSDKNKKHTIKYVSCGPCRTQLAVWKKGKWYY